VSPTSYADERILDYHSEIYVQKDASMRVIETIKVFAENKKIKRGLYRDFPTTYKDRLGNRYVVSFEIENIKRNDSTEPYHTKKLSNGIRTYIGSKNRIIEKGEHIYTLTYSTNRQLGFFDNHDELYWNVTGNDWDFPIDKASATVHLPDDVTKDSIKFEAYTGKSGSTDRNYTALINDEGLGYFETTKKLGHHEGLTIVIGWPKGYIVEPTLADKFDYVIRDNQGIFNMFVGTLILLAYYFFTWLKVGKDPEAGIIIPQYEPPTGYSPASMRFIEKMGYDNTCFAVAIINLAVKGYLRIDEYDGEYTIEKTGQKVNMAPGESKLVRNLLGKTKKTELTQSNHGRIKNALNAHEASLKRDYEKIYFVTNSIYFGVGIALTIIILLVSLFSQLTTETIAPLIFLTVWLTIWSFAVIGLVKNAWNAWRQVNNIINIVPAFTATLFALPFLFFEVMAIGMYAKLSSWLFPTLLIFTVLINWIFYELLKAPTRAGRELLDKIEGFRRYINVAEKIELDYRYPGGRTPEVFEAYLPYTLALGIEQEWCEQFADVFEQNDQTGHIYSPKWYSGSHWNPVDAGSFTSSLGSSFTSAISSSSTAPGSSSGMSGGFSGGGGSSGGGGGGGGGGGW
jgi:uncharacterized membrane protein YgcG